MGLFDFFDKNLLLKGSTQASLEVPKKLPLEESINERQIKFYMHNELNFIELQILPNPKYVVSEAVIDSIRILLNQLDFPCDFKVLFDKLISIFGKDDLEKFGNISINIGTVKKSIKADITDGVQINYGLLSTFTTTRDGKTVTISDDGTRYYQDSSLSLRTYLNEYNIKLLGEEPISLSSSVFTSQMIQAKYEIKRAERLLEKDFQLTKKKH